MAKKENNNKLIKHKLKEYPKGTGFLTYPNELFRNEIIKQSADARMMHMLLLSSAETFHPSKKWLMDICDLSKDRYLKAKKELEKNGFLKVSKIPNYDGNHGYVFLYEVCEYPNTEMGIEFQDTEFKTLKSRPENRDTEIEPLKNKKSKIKSKKKKENKKIEKVSSLSILKGEVDG